MQIQQEHRTRKRALNEWTRLAKLALPLALLALLATFVPLSANVKTAQAATITCPAQIASGSTGSLVKELQAALDLDASMLFNLTIDGQFGSLTKAAVITFQKAAFPTDSSQWDGIVGPHTWGALGFCRSSGTTGGGCTTAGGVEACISLNSSRFTVSDGYVRANNIAEVWIEVLHNGDAGTCNSGLSTEFPSNGQHFACNESYLTSSGESWGTIAYGQKTDGTLFLVVSPPQYV